MAETPVQVVLSGPVPVPVEVTNGKVLKDSAHVQSQEADPSLPARTTFQEDLVAAGQRHVNITWEYTQAAVTILITVAVIYCEIMKIDAQTLKLMFVAICSTYYARTNHTKIGGVEGKYEGR